MVEKVPGGTGVRHMTLERSRKLMWRPDGVREAARNPRKWGTIREGRLELGRIVARFDRELGYRLTLSCPKDLTG
mgnify:CR=1 FL=1